MWKLKNFKKVLNAHRAIGLLLLLMQLWGTLGVANATPGIGLVRSRARLAVAQADSLLAVGDYTAAANAFTTLAARAPSPALLLRLAFAHEQAGQVPDALWALRRAYELRPDRSVLRKMDVLAATHHLTGYEYGDRYFFFTLLRRYYEWLVEGLLIVGVIIATVLLLRRRRKPRAQPWAGALLTYVGLAALGLNLLLPERLGREVIVRDPTPLMSAPSAGGRWLTTVPAGQQLPVFGSAEDIWLPVRWQGARAWVRRTALY